MSQLSYFYGKEADQFSFFTVPKILFKDPEYKDMPCEAKMLYGMMLDRMSLSIENQWFDDQKRAFIKISEDFIMENLGCGRNKALNLMKILEQSGLIERKKMGQGKSSIIYVKRFIRQETVQEEIVLDESAKTDISTASIIDEEEKGIAFAQTVATGQKFKNQTSEDNAAVSEVYFLNNKTFRNQTSGSLESKQQDVYFSNPNNTKINNTELNNTESNHIISSDSANQTSDAMGCDTDLRAKLQGYSALIRENIDMSGLLMANPHDGELIEGIFDLILETVMCEGEKILIASNWYPVELVKSKFLKLNYSHIDYALYCLKGNTTKVKNIKKYLLAVLFNAPSTMDGYFQAEVRHDMPQLAY
ncbi:DUF6017 domain-containing protein [Fusicatenibacter sp.]